MKIRIFSLLLNFFIIGQISAQSAECVIIRVSYAKKASGSESRLSIDIGKSTTHSLYGKIKNLEDSNTVQITNEDGKLIIFNNEVDLMNYLFMLGYKYISYFHTVIINTEFHNFILIKEKL
jgi:hypothetical protein